MNTYEITLNDDSKFYIKANNMAQAIGMAMKDKKEKYIDEFCAKDGKSLGEVTEYLEKTLKVTRSELIENVEVLIYFGDES
jgi:hypothetical protein